MIATALAPKEIVIVGRYCAAASFPHMYSPWLYVGPEAIYWATRLVNQLWSPKELYITENVASSSDVPDSDGMIVDSDRIACICATILASCIGQSQKACR